MTDHALARSFFPLMPDAVFDAWIGEIIAANGWPFVSVEEPFKSDLWTGYFLGFPLADWANAIWTQRTLEQSATRLAPHCARRIMDVGTHAACGFPAFIGSHVTDSASRVHAHRAFICRTNTFPGFITALDTGGGILDIADGCHRMAALWSSGTTGIQIPAWIASDGLGIHRCSE